MKYSSVCIAIIASLTAFSSTANENPNNNSAVEVIEVKGSYFNDYKVDEANGAMRADISLLETSQSVTVIPNSIMTEQLATTLGEVLTNDASLTAGSKQRNREVFNLRGFSLS